MGLGRKATQGAAWNYAAFLISRGLLFVDTMILARILSPAEFGLVGMALPVMGLLDRSTVLALLALGGGVLRLWDAV